MHRVTPRRTVSTGTVATNANIPRMGRSFQQQFNHLIVNQTKRIEQHLQQQHGHDAAKRQLSNSNSGNGSNTDGGTRTNSFSAIQQNMLGDMLLSSVASVMSSSSSPTNDNGSQSRKKSPRRLGRRRQRHNMSSSSSSNNSNNNRSRSSSASSLLDGINNALEGIQNNLKSNNDSSRKTVFGGDNENEDTKKMEQMKLYLLTELQARPRNRSILEDEQSMRRLGVTGGGGSSSNGIRSSSISSNLDAGDLATHSESQTEISQMIQVDVVSQWNNNNKHSQTERRSVIIDDDETSQTVVDATFGAVPSLVCILLQSSKTPRSQRMAQVCYIDEAGEFVSVVPLTMSLEHVEQSVVVGHSSGGNLGGSESNLIDTNGTKKIETEDFMSPSDPDSFAFVGLDYEPVSECFVISSIYGRNEHWIGCLWNWRSNALGWVIRGNHRSKVWSRLSLVNDEDKGWNMVHTTVDALAKVKSTMDVTTQVVSAGFLSPPTSLAGGSTLSEASSLMVSADFLAFPATKRNLSDPSSLDLKWVVSSLPTAYVADYGPPRIAAVGPMEYKSIALASSRGMCILDAHRPSGHRWKQFSVNEERAFSVVAMTWWEGTRYSNRDIETDDLLVAIIRNRTGRQYLSCWSNRRLDLFHQLLESPDPNWKSHEQQDPTPLWGVELPNEFSATHLSLLAEPRNEMVTSDRPRRAVVFIYALDHDRSEFDYISFRLQAYRPKRPKNPTPDQNVPLRSYVVFAHESLLGRLQNGTRSVGPVQSIFLAGASFRFDLRQFARKKKKIDPVEDESGLVVTLGVIRYGGMEAVCLASMGRGWIERMTSFELSRVWLADVIHLEDDSDTEPSTYATFVWAFELVNGHISCWSPPSLLNTTPDHVDDWQMSTMLKKAKIDRPQGLHLPSLVCQKESRAPKKRWALGTTCQLGTASDFMQHSSSGSKFHMELGNVPGSHFGCTLRAGQIARRIMAASNTSSDLRSVDNHEYVNSQSSFLLTPPAFVLSVNALLLEAAALRMEVSVMKAASAAATRSILEVEVRRLREIDRHVHRRLASARNKDSVMMALRLLILHSIEIVSTSNKRYTKSPSDAAESDLLLATSYFSGIVDAVRESTTNLQYASLFLEVGRQVEPSSLEYLFPLPLPARSETNDESMAEARGRSGGRMLDKTSARTVSDLFTMCVGERSLAAAASALPLFPTKPQALQYSQMLLDEAIHAFVGNTSTHECHFDSTEEERRVIGDIFRFAIKLEDSEPLDEMNGTSTKVNDGSTNETNGGTHAKSRAGVNNRASMSEGSESEGNGGDQNRDLICGSGTFLKYIVPSTIVRESEKVKEEEAIRKEASSFIKNSLDDPVIGFSTLPDWDDPTKPDLQLPLSDVTSISGLVGDALVDLLHSTRTDNNWSAIRGLSEMLMGQDTSTTSGGFNKSPNLDVFRNVSEMAHILDVLSIIPESYDMNEGSEECISTYLATQIVAYNQNPLGDNTTEAISTQSSHNVFGLSLMLLNRVDALSPSLLTLAGTAGGGGGGDVSTAVEDQSVLELGLVIIVMVAAYHCDQSDILLDHLDPDCLMAKSYKAAIEETEEEEEDDENEDDNEEDYDE